VKILNVEEVARSLIQAALGNVALDLLVQDVRLLDVPVM
jgi:hypothetical protein